MKDPFVVRYYGFKEEDMAELEKETWAAEEQERKQLAAARRPSKTKSLEQQPTQADKGFNIKNVGQALILKRSPGVVKLLVLLLFLEVTSCNLFTEFISAVEFMTIGIKPAFYDVGYKLIASVIGLSLAWVADSYFEAPVILMAVNGALILAAYPFPSAFHANLTSYYLIIIPKIILYTVYSAMLFHFAIAARELWVRELSDRIEDTVCIFLMVISFCHFPVYAVTRFFPVSLPFLVYVQIGLTSTYILLFLVLRRYGLSFQPHAVRRLPEKVIRLNISRWSNDWWCTSLIKTKVPDIALEDTELTDTTMKTSNCTAWLILAVFWMDATFFYLRNNFYRFFVYSQRRVGYLSLNAEDVWSITVLIDFINTPVVCWYVVPQMFAKWITQNLESYSLCIAQCLTVVAVLLCLTNEHYIQKSLKMVPAEGEGQVIFYNGLSENASVELNRVHNITVLACGSFLERHIKGKGNFTISANVKTSQTSFASKLDALEMESVSYTITDGKLNRVEGFDGVFITKFSTIQKNKAQISVASTLNKSYHLNTRSDIGRVKNFTAPMNGERLTMMLATGFKYTVFLHTDKYQSASLTNMTTKKLISRSKYSLFLTTNETSFNVLVEPSEYPETFILISIYLLSMSMVIEKFVLISFILKENQQSILCFLLAVWFLSNKVGSVMVMAMLIVFSRVVFLALNLLVTCLNLIVFFYFALYEEED